MRKKPNSELIDNENPEWGTPGFGAPRRGPEALREIFGAKVAGEIERKRGRPKAASTKQPTNIRLDADVLAAWKSTGSGWQTRMADVLRKHAPGAK